MLMVATLSVSIADQGMHSESDGKASQPIYQLATRGVCLENIKTLAECTAAAATLKPGAAPQLKQLTAVLDSSSQASDDAGDEHGDESQHAPPFCYVVMPLGPTDDPDAGPPPAAELKFNALGTNQGGCSLFNACVCRGELAEQQDEGEEDEGGSPPVLEEEFDPAEGGEGGQEAPLPMVAPVDELAPVDEPTQVPSTPAADSFAPEEETSVEDNTIAAPMLDPMATEAEMEAAAKAAAGFSLSAKHKALFAEPSISQPLHDADGGATDLIEADDTSDAAPHGRRLSYSLRTSGRCPTAITSYSACAAAATALSLADRTVASNYYSCAQSLVHRSQCPLPLEPRLCPVVARLPLGHYVLPAPSALLTLRWLPPLAAPSPSTDSFYPPYCYYHSWGYLAFNYYGRNTGSCSSSYRCLCAAPPPPSASPPPPSPSPPPPYDMDLYEIRTSGKCASPITSKSTCLRAAQVMYSYSTTYVYRELRLSSARILEPHSHMSPWAARGRIPLPSPKIPALHASQPAPPRSLASSRLLSLP